MNQPVWGLTAEEAARFNDLVVRYALDEVIDFEELMSRLEPLLSKLHGFIYQKAEKYMAGDSYLADELAGRVIVDLFDEKGRIWSMTRKYDGKFWYAISRKFKDFYYEIMNALEKNRVELGSLVCELEEGERRCVQLPDTVEDPEEFAVLKESTRRLLTRLGDLLTPAELRHYVLVTVKRQQGYTTEEIARDLELAESTVTSWYSRIKKRVLEEVSGYGN